MVGIPGNGTGFVVASFKKTYGEKEAELETTKGNGIGRARTGVGLWVSMNAGAIANDISRRRSPHKLTPKQPSKNPKSSQLSGLQGRRGGLGPGVVTENRNRTIDDAGWYHHDPFNHGINGKSTTPGEWVRPKRKPIESNVPRRQPIGMISQSESALDRHTDGTSSSFPDTCFVALNIQNRTKELVLGLAEGAHTER